MINVIHVHSLDDVPKVVEKLFYSSNYEGFVSICVKNQNSLKKFKVLNNVIGIDYNTLLNHTTKDFVDIVYNKLLREFDRYPQEKREGDFFKLLSYVESLCINYIRSVVSALDLEPYKPSNSLIENLAYKVMDIVNILIKGTKSSLIHNTLFSSPIMYMQENLLLDIFHYFGRAKLYLITFYVKKSEEFTFLCFILNRSKEEPSNDKASFHMPKLNFNPSILLALSGRCDEYERVIDVVSKGGLLQSQSSELGPAGFLAHTFFAEVFGIYKDAAYHLRIDSNNG